MGVKLTFTKGTDSTAVIPATRENLNGTVLAAQDLTGAYAYFQVYGANNVLLLAKDNDPSGANVGITFGTNAVNVTLHHDDLEGEPAGDLAYRLLIRLDPGGADDRYVACCGTLVVEDCDIALDPDPVSLPVPGTTTWYVRDAGDDDLNDGKSAATAFATLEKAIAMLKPDPTGRSRQIVNLTGFTGSITTAQYLSLPSTARNIELDFARDTTIPHTDYFDMPIEFFAEPVLNRNVTITGIVTDAITTTNAVITVSDTLTTNELQGMVIFDGPFRQGVIQSNTVNDIIVASYTGDYSGTVGVYEQSCTLNYGDSGDSFIGATFTTNGTVIFNGIKFSGDNSGNVGAGFVFNDETYFNVCYFDGFWSEPASRLAAFFDCYFTGNCHLENPHEMTGCVFQSCTVLDGHGTSGAGKNAFTYCIIDDCVPIGGGNFEQAVDLELHETLISNARDAAILISTPFSSRINNVRINDSATDAIRITVGGGVLKTRNVAGTGNGGYGLKILNGGQCLYQVGSGVNTVTGTDGEVKVGDSAASLWSDTMPRTDVGETNPEFCRIYGS